MSQVHSLFLLYWAAFKIHEHFACTHPHGAFVAHSTCYVTSTYWTGVLCSRAWVRMYSRFDICRSFWWIWICNYVTDQFSRFELTRGRKSVEMNSGLSGYELISICWHLLLPDSFTSCRLRSLEPDSRVTHGDVYVSLTFTKFLTQLVQ